MRCEWIEIRPRVYQCARCGKVIGVAQGITPRWDRFPPCPGPTPTQRLWNYATAVRRWILAGRPQRSDREIQALLEICQSCVHYADNVCRKCGCRLGGKHALVSKLRMRTERCPIGKW